MRIGILAHSFSSAFKIYKAVADVPGHEVFIILSPSPHRSARISHLANFARLVLASLKGSLRVFVTRKVIFLNGPFDDPKSIDTLAKLKLDVGLHKAGVIYRDATINAFRLGILNHHIGMLPAYRGRSVLEWSILQGDPVGITVFFIDTGIDTGARILLSEAVDISGCKSISEAKQYLFDLDQVFFPKALALLRDSASSFQLNDGSGRRYFVMSRLFQGVVDQLLQAATRGRWSYELAGVCFLLIVLSLQLFFSVRRESQTWDEANHIYCGYRTWTHGDFGLNPEHPPLVKLLATAPLLWSEWKTPVLEERYFKEDAFLRGKEFLYQNDAEKILARTRTAAAVLTLLTALVVFFATREMFGRGAAFTALTLMTFDPNLLAHGALITTDVAFACFMLLSVYLFYRFVKSSSALRLFMVGASVGLALAAKHTGVLILPVLFVLALCEIVLNRFGINRALRFLGSLVLIMLIGWVVLWSFYGFRYAARSDGLQLNPPLAEYVKGLQPQEAWPISAMARVRALPESYLYGMADIKLTANYYTSYVLGQVYAHSVWFYFPITFLIKSTIGVLALFLLSLAIVATRRLSWGREILFLLVPPLVYLTVALTTGMNIGVRHVLIVYVFLYVLIGGAVWALIRKSSKWAYVVGVLLLLHVASSLMTFPNYIAYGNELWGGPSQTHKYLTDSNADWGEQLKSVKQYLDQRGVKECWFVYFAAGVAEPGYYGIPCKPLPTINTLWLNLPIDVPTSIDGPVLISASNLSGYEFGPGSLDPYGQFKHLTPTAVIDRGIFVFDGKFDLPLAVAITKAQKAQNLIQAKQLDEALQEAQAAVALAPNAIQAQLALGDVLHEMGQPQQARTIYEKALELAKTIEPEFQIRSIPGIEERLQSIAGTDPQH